MALAALQLNKRSPSLVVNDPGFYTFGGHTFRSHEGGLGGVDMHRAIQFSSNTYFIRWRWDMGVDAIHDFMKPLGFGQSTGIDQRRSAGHAAQHRVEAQHLQACRNEALVPAKPCRWALARACNNFTMLQLALAEATLANGGIRYRPHMAKAVKNSVTGAITEIVQPPASTWATCPRTWNWCAMPCGREQGRHGHAGSPWARPTPRRARSAPPRP